MTSRRFVFAALGLGVAALATTPLAAQKRYRMEVKTKVTQDLTVMGQGQQTQEFTNVGFATLSAKDSADGQAVTVVLDSLQPGQGSPLTAEQLKGAAGSTWHGFRGPDGRVKHLALTGDNPVAASVEPLMNTLFPPLKKGATAGQSWTDTTESEAMMGVAARTVTNLVTSADNYQGAKVLKLAGASSTAISGTAESPQGPLAIEGTGSGNNTWYIQSDGTLVAQLGTASQSLTVSISVAPEPIPVSFQVESATTLLK